MSGLIVIPGGVEAMREAMAIERYAEQEDAALKADQERCMAQGHIFHTCPACGDFSCLRCGQVGG